MSDGPHDQNNPFAAYWQQMMSSMPTPPGIDQDQSLKQMQRIFFDAWAKACDDFMRSPQFLGILKQTMDASLQARQQFNDMMGKAQHATQSPTTTDVDDMIALVRQLEERVLAKVENIESDLAEISSRFNGTQRSKTRSPSTRQSARPAAIRKTVKKVKKAKKAKSKKRR